MVSVFEKNGFTELNTEYKDLEIYSKDNVGLISMKKFKDDIKAHRQSGNHLDYDLMRELKEALLFFQNESRIHKLIITSSHKVAFSRGAKIEDVLGASEEKCRDFLSKAQDLLLTLQKFTKPVIAAINGLTLGGGFELSLACDYRIASSRENVVFGFPETSLGLIPAMGGTQNLRRIIGEKQARYIISESIINITSEKAKVLGIVENIFPPKELINEAFILANRKGIGKQFHPEKVKADLSANTIRKEIISFLKNRQLKPDPRKTAAPIAAALTDFLFTKTDENQYLNGLLYEYEVFCYLQQTEDCYEGIQALTEERKPFFKGK
ncbi:MAG: enoyl-CoA hydratase/isomerase family protein [Spirochaetaceae bacterium]|nr:enoyl-CoA hydratase/isomerase family protein [Spirochaetaceae bacterium]